MSNVYLMRFNGGCGGDFLCQEISKDENFYDYIKVESDKNNTWNIVSPIDELGVKIKDVYSLSEVEISREASDALNQTFINKHLVLATHWINEPSLLPIPRQVPINLIFDDKMAILFFGLLWIKRYTVKPEHSLSIPELESYVTSNPSNRFKADKIIEKGFMYGFEAAVLRFNYQSTLDFITYFFKYYKSNHAEMLKLNPVFLDVGKLFLESNTQVHEWQKAFDMRMPLDVIALNSYHQTNLKLFELAFNKKYDSYMSDQDFLHDLYEYVNRICPDISF